MKKILMIIGQKDFRDEEFLEPRSVFKDEGFEVTVASREAGNCSGMLGASVTAEKSVNEVDISAYDALVFSGGPGSLMFENDEKVHSMISEVINEDKVLGSICISPRILMAAGVLKDRKFTMWNPDGSQDEYIKNSGGDYTKKDLEVDGKIVTADGPGSAKKFGKKVAELLKFV